MGGWNLGRHGLSEDVYKRQSIGFLLSLTLQFLVQSLPEEVTLQVGEKEVVHLSVFPPVSYTHLDVYKRQGRSRIGKLTYSKSIEKVHLLLDEERDFFPIPMYG